LPFTPEQAREYGRKGALKRWGTKKSKETISMRPFTSPRFALSLQGRAPFIDSCRTSMLELAQALQGEPFDWTVPRVETRLKPWAEWR
jgi:hypothetical protein